MKMGITEGPGNGDEKEKAPEKEQGADVTEEPSSCVPEEEPGEGVGCIEPDPPGEEVELEVRGIADLLQELVRLRDILDLLQGRAGVSLSDLEAVLTGDKVGIISENLRLRLKRYIDRGRNPSVVKSEFAQLVNRRAKLLLTHVKTKTESFDGFTDLQISEMEVTNQFISFLDLSTLSEEDRTDEFLRAVFESEEMIELRNHANNLINAMFDSMKQDVEKAQDRIPQNFAEVANLGHLSLQPARWAIWAICNFYENVAKVVGHTRFRNVVDYMLELNRYIHSQRLAAKTVEFFYEALRGLHESDSDIGVAVPVRILDVGARTGDTILAIARMLRKKGYLVGVEALDVVPMALAFQKYHPDAEIFKGLDFSLLDAFVREGNILDFKSAPLCEIISAMAILHKLYKEEQRLAVANIYKNLIPGGYAIFTIPSVDTDAAMDKVELVDTGSGYKITFDEFKDILKEQGFEVVRHQRVSKAENGLIDGFGCRIVLVKKVGASPVHALDKSANPVFRDEPRGAGGESEETSGSGGTAARSDRRKIKKSV